MQFTSPSGTDRLVRPETKVQPFATSAYRTEGGAAPLLRSLLT